MICLLAGNYKEALTFAKGQNLDKNEWFFPENVHDLNFKQNFHVLVIGTAGENVPSLYFDKIYELAQKRGRIGRK